MTRLLLVAVLFHKNEGEKWLDGCTTFLPARKVRGIIFQWLCHEKDRDLERVVKWNAPVVVFLKFI